MDWFTDLDRGTTRLGVAGKVRTGRQAAETLERGADFVMVGRASILHHDFPENVRRDGGFEPVPTPVSPDHLTAEGLSPVFVEYMRNWRGFVADAS
jgi:2,4-dienoyl-CoA reductase-like NADH-dependent reductase (Old Yellow Enzyme family)